MNPPCMHHRLEVRWTGHTLTLETCEELARDAERYLDRAKGSHLVIDLHPVDSRRIANLIREQDGTFPPPTPMPYLFQWCGIRFRRERALDEGTWRASILMDEKEVSIGGYTMKEKAGSRAYDELMEALHGFSVNQFDRDAFDVLVFSLAAWKEAGEPGRTGIFFHVNDDEPCAPPSTL